MKQKTTLMNCLIIVMIIAFPLLAEMPNSKEKSIIQPTVYSFIFFLLLIDLIKNRAHTKFYRLSFWICISCVAFQLWLLFSALF